MFGWDPFQYQITKYVMRWKDKNGIQDLEKAAHFLEKYIEATKSGYQTRPLEFNPAEEDAKLFGPKSGSGHLTTDRPWVDPMFKKAEVKQTGYVGFTYEGGSAEWDLYTCRKCRAEIRPAVNVAPFCENCSKLETHT
jgi:hypothetical protein